MNAPLATGRLVNRGDAWFLFRDPAPVSLTGTGIKSDVHVCSAGEWLGHPDGPFELTAQTFATWIKNAEGQKTPLSVDYEHRTFNDQAPDSRAAGWVEKLEVRGAGESAELWATVEWTAKAAEMIRAGEYRFNSPVFRLDAIDKQTGEDIGPRLLQIALTNFPFFDGQTPIKCTEQPLRAAETTMTPEEEAAKKKQDEEAAAKKAAEGDGGEQYAQAVAAFVDGVAKAAGVDTAAAVAAMTELSEKIGALVRDRLDADGMPSEEPMAAKEENKETDSQRAERIEREAIAARLKATEEAQAKLASEVAADKKARDEATAAEKKAAIEKQADEIINAGRATDSQRDDVIFMLTNRPEAVERTYGVQRVPIGKRQAGPEPKTVRASETQTDPDLRPHEQKIVKNLIAMGIKTDRAKSRVLAMREQLDDGAKRVGLLTA